MTREQTIWAIIAATILILNLPLIGYVRYLFIQRKIEMVIAEFQTVLDQLNNLVAPVTALKAAADAGSVSVQDVTDTVSALQTAVNSVAAAAGQATQ